MKYFAKEMEILDAKLIENSDKFLGLNRKGKLFLNENISLRRILKHL